jgi:hypothetical protein
MIGVRVLPTLHGLGSDALVRRGVARGCVVELSPVELRM